MISSEGFQRQCLQRPCLQRPRPRILEIVDLGPTSEIKVATRGAEDDTVDLRAVLHRDGSVLARGTLEQLQTPEALYQQLGCKLAVGMPFKDVATVAFCDAQSTSEIHEKVKKNPYFNKKNNLYGHL